jgi:hypothetical protein
MMASISSCEAHLGVMTFTATLWPRSLNKSKEKKINKKKTKGKYV